MAYLHVQRHLAENGIIARTETRSSERDTCMYGDAWLRMGYLHVRRQLRKVYLQVRRHIAHNGIPISPETVAQNGIPARTETHSL